MMRMPESTHRTTRAMATRSPMAGMRSLRFVAVLPCPGLLRHDGDGEAVDRDHADACAARDRRRAAGPPVLAVDEHLPARRADVRQRVAGAPHEPGRAEVLRPAA